MAKIRITLDMDVDMAAWNDEYGLSGLGEDFKADVLDYVRDAIESGTYAFGDIKIATVEDAKVAGRRG